MEMLLSFALFKRDKYKRTFPVKGLVQTSFKHFIGSDDRQIYFNNAALLVSAAFPRKDIKPS